MNLRLPLFRLPLFRLPLFLLTLQATAFQFSWRDDRGISAGLRNNGIVRQKDRATLFFERGQLSDDEMNSFSDLVEQGVRDAAQFAGRPVPDAGIRYFISSEIQISHSRGTEVYLPASRIRDRTAPYLHETVHVVAPCDECPEWLSEGYASYAQSYLAEHGHGYDGKVFSTNGNNGIDRDAVRWLHDERGQAMLPFVGTGIGDPDLSDRRNAAAPFYELAQSFSKYLFENAGFKGLAAIHESTDLAVYRANWLLYLKNL